MLSTPLSWRLALLAGGLLGSVTWADAQQYNPIITAVPFLRLSPDARSAALGQAGVALSPDANSAFYNAGRLSFVPADYGLSASYIPWLRTYTSDTWLGSLAGYARLSERSVIGADLRCLNRSYSIANRFSTIEYAIGASYSYQLSEHLGVGAMMRYIRVNTDSLYTPSQAVAASLGVYYHKDLGTDAGLYKLRLGAAINNVGSTLAYTRPAAANSPRADFLPTALQIGGALTRTFTANSTLTLTVDASKLLVPTPTNVYTPAATKSVINGMVASFSDAPGGFREETREVRLSTGLEYAYKQSLFARAGYYYENQFKGDGRYASVGVGARYHALGFDGTYLIPSSRQNPLTQVLRLSLHLALPQSSTAYSERT